MSQIVLQLSRPKLSQNTSAGILINPFIYYYAEAASIAQYKYMHSTHIKILIKY